MGKMVVPALGLVVIGVLAWALMRSPGGGDAARVDAPPSAASQDVKPAPTSAAEAEAAPGVRPPVVVRNALAVRPEAARRAEAAPNVPPVADEEAPISQMPMPTAAVADVKEVVRSYYGNLPRSGKMPAKVTLEELLPAAVVSALGARPDAPMTMLGNRKVDVREAYTDVLEMGEDYQQMLGVSWLEPDGTEQRNYIRLEVPEKLPR